MFGWFFDEIVQHEAKTKSMLEYMKEIENKKRVLEEEVDQRNATIAQLKAKELTTQDLEEKKNTVR